MWKNIGKSALWFALYWIASTIGMAVAGAVYGVMNADQFVNGMENIDMTAFLANVAVPYLGVASIIVVIAFLIYKKVRKHPIELKTIKPSNLAFAVGVGLLMNFVISIVVGALSLVLSEELYSALNQSTGTATQTASFWLTLAVTGILVPIMEEIVFRYGIFGTLARSNVIVAYIVSAVVFGLMHGNPIQICYTAILGVVMAFLYHKGKNIWYAIAVHIAVNSSSIIITQLPDVGGFVLLGVGVVGFVIALVMIFCSKNVRALFKKNKPEAVIAE